MSGAARPAMSRLSDRQHIAPSHFWSSSYVPPSHYWNHSQAHSLLDVQHLSIHETHSLRFASLPHPPKPPAPAADMQQARTLERASKSSSLKRLCGKGVSRMGSYLETLHRSSRLGGIAEVAPDADADVEATAVGPEEGGLVTRLAGRRLQLRSSVSGVLARAREEEAGSAGISSEGSDDNSGESVASPAPSSHIYIDMPPRCRRPPGWNCASGSDPDEDEEAAATAAGSARGPRPRAGSAPAGGVCACRAPRAQPEPDPWDHRAIEYVMVPKAQYVSLYRANRLLRDTCCCQGLGQASRLCDKCRQPTVILRSPSPAGALQTASRRGGQLLVAGTGSLQSRAARAAMSASPPPTEHSRARTLLPRLRRDRAESQKPPQPRSPAHFSSQELLLDHAARSRTFKPTKQSSPAPASAAAEPASSGVRHVSMAPTAGSTGSLPRGAARLDYADSWRSLSHNTSGSAVAASR